MNAQTNLRGALLASAAVLVAAPAVAQDTFELDTVYLAESKREVQTDTALAETVVDQEEMDDRQASTIAELVETVPGVNLINGTTPSGSGINIRGLGATSSYGTDGKVAIQVDGASAGSEELYRIGTQLFTDPELYREVTVIRGMAGTYEYGSGIIGGLIRLDTKDASDFTGGVPGFRFRETLQYTSNGNGFVSSSILAWQPTENFEVLGNYTYRTIGVQDDGAGNPIGTEGFTLPSWAVAAKYTFGAYDEHYFRFSYSDTSSADRDVPYDTFGTTTDMFGNVDRDTHSRTAVLTYGYDSPHTDLVNITATLSYADQQIDSSYIAGSSTLEGTPYFPTVQALADADHRYQTTKFTLKNQAYFFTGAISHDLRFGVEASRRERLDASSAPGGVDNRLALFAVDDMSWGGFTLTPALRYEAQDIGGAGYADYTNSALMGGVTGRHEFGNGLAFFASAAYTESLPILDDLTNPTYMTQSEKARSFEAGISFDRGSVFAEGDNLALKANVYHTTMWDITSYSGVTDAVLYGAELEASYSMENGLYFDLNANVMRGLDTTGGGSADWAGIPSDQGRLTLGKRWGEEFDLSWEVVADAEMTRSATPSPATVVHNLRGAWKPQSGFLKGTQLRVGVENLLDLDYTPHLATRPAPGRTIKFSIAHTF